MAKHPPSGGDPSLFDLPELSPDSPTPPQAREALAGHGTSRTAVALHEAAQQRYLNYAPRLSAPDPA